MQYNSLRQHRRSARLRGYDYTQAGAYFVTICTQGKNELYVAIVPTEVRPNTLGRIVTQC